MISGAGGRSVNTTMFLEPFFDRTACLLHSKRFKSGSRAGSRSFVVYTVSTLFSSIFSIRLNFLFIVFGPFLFILLWYME